MSKFTLISLFTTLLVISLLGVSIFYSLQKNLNSDSIQKIIEEIYAIKYLEEVKERDNSYNLPNPELHSKLLTECAQTNTSQINLAQTDTPINCTSLSLTNPEEINSFIHNSIIESEKSDITPQIEKNPLSKMSPYLITILIFFILSSILTIFLTIHFSSPKLKSLRTLGLTFIITGLISIITSQASVDTSKLGEQGTLIIFEITKLIDKSFIYLGIIGLILTTIYFAIIILYPKNRAKNQNPYKSNNLQ